MTRLVMIPGVVPVVLFFLLRPTISAQAGAKFEDDCCNRIDDDGDSKIDFADTDCSKAPYCPCDREQAFELFFTNGSKHQFLHEGIVRQSRLGERSTISIRNRAEIAGVQLDAVRTPSGGEHVYVLRGTHADGQGNPVPSFRLTDGTLVVPGRPNRLATGGRVLSVEPGAAVQGSPGSFVIDMDPPDIDGFRVQYGDIIGRSDETPLCLGVEFLVLDVADPGDPVFLRGDPDASGGRDLSDAIRILEWLFRRGESPACELAADVNDDERINVLDPILLLQWLFAGPPETPPRPWRRCGNDPTEGRLSCEMGCVE